MNTVPATSAALPLPYAAIWRRVLAGIIDFLILAVPTYYLALVLGHDPDLPAGLQTRLVYVDVYKTLSLAIHWLYAASLESSAWQATPGKMALGIRVTDLEGNRISFWRASLRYFAKGLSAITMGIGYLMATFTKRRQTLHDIIAKTLIIQKR